MTEGEVSFSRIVSDRVVEVRSNTGQVLAGIDVARVASNGTYMRGRTNEEGRWAFSDAFLGTVTLLAAAPGWNGTFHVLEEEKWTSPLLMETEPLREGGSIIFERGSGEIPGLSGRLNPIRDSLGRTYIYGDNLSFNDSPDQPFNFIAGANFSVADAVANEFSVSVLAILGRTSLMRYRRTAASPLVATP